ncbi:MAG: prepilin-type N-terminal cleavage/methylation domain-containing protein [Clostridiales bacterium]|nr:prepilin-type N-terminal cleavage/methylation domain-containing protein [Clostridiales bacterium]
MKNSKKGFTLTEVLIVTAIIVILGGAAIAGIAVSIKNAQDSSNDLKSKQGENWESEAVLEVKKTKVGLGVEQIYEESADTPAPTNAATSNNEELSSTPTDTPATTPDGSSGTGGGSGSTDTGSDSTGTGTGSTGTGTGSTGSGGSSSSAAGSTQTNLSDLPSSSVKTDNWGRNVVIANTPLPVGWSEQGYSTVEIVIECDGNVEGLNGADNCSATYSGNTVTLTVTDVNQSNIAARIYTSSGSAKVVSVTGYN